MGFHRRTHVHCHPMFHRWLMRCRLVGFRCRTRHCQLLHRSTQYRMGCHRRRRLGFRRHIHHTLGAKWCCCLVGGLPYLGGILQSLLPYGGILQSLLSILSSPSSPMLLLIHYW